MYHETQQNLDKSLQDILTEKARAFNEKVFDRESSTPDVLMNAFSLTHDVKDKDPQYWSRSLGSLFQDIVVKTCEASRPDITPPIRVEKSEPCDFIMGKFAIDTKYRFGSGDSKTSKLICNDARILIDLGFIPVMLILRTDSLASRIKAFKNAGWKVLEGDAAFDFIKTETGIDLKKKLIDAKGKFNYSSVNL